MQKHACWDFSYVKFKHGWNQPMVFNMKATSGEGGMVIRKEHDGASGWAKYCASTSEQFIGLYIEGSMFRYMDYTS